MTMLQAHTLVRSLVPLQSCPSDAELLAALHRDASAFDTLVERYSDMVLRVCHRVLQHRQDAEDALQATFLIFHRQIHTLRSHASLGSFLHGIALRTSLNLRRLRQRRQWHEAQSARMPVSTDYRWSDVQVVLDEEIARLPEPYREVFIHCCLERTSRAETASILGVKEGTISSRLTQAKKQLQDRLTRRGITLGTLLGAISLSEVNASSELQSSTVNAIRSASPSPLVERLVLSHATGLQAFSLKPMTALLAMLALIVGAAAWCHPAPELQVDLNPQWTSISSTDEPHGTSLSAFGTVVNPAGQPVAGAKVYLRQMQMDRNRSPWQQEQPPKDILALQTCDAQGQFRFKDIVTPYIASAYHRNQYPYDLLVEAPGYAFSWQRLTQPLQQQPLYFQLRPAASISGTIRESSGQLAAGALVQLLDIGPLRRMPRQHGITSESQTSFVHSGVQIKAIADNQGRFTITGLPAQSCVSLQVTHRGWVERDPVYVSVGDQSQLDLSELSYSSERGASLSFAKVQISPCSIILQARKDLKVIVRAEATGKALAGIQVQIGQGNGIRTTVMTSSEGHASLSVLPREMVFVICQEVNQFKYLHRTVTLRDLPDGPVEVKLTRGFPLTGKLLDAQTRKPIARTVVYYGRSPAPGVPGKPHIDWQAGAETDATGHFRLMLPAGPVHLMASSEDQHLQTEISELDIKPGVAVVPVEMLLFTRQDGLVKGRVIDADGKPVAGASVGLGRTFSRGQFFAETISDGEGRFAVSAYGYQPKDRVELVVSHKASKQGVILAVDDPTTAQTLEAKVAPLATLTGRVLDHHGKPVRNAVVKLWESVYRDGTTSFGQHDHLATLTDEQGRYRLENIHPNDGTKYRAMISAHGYCRVSAKEVVLIAGDLEDTGDICLVPASESIAGIVVDRAGKPLANVQLSASPTNVFGETILQSNSGGLITQADGKFSFHDLPKGSITLFWEKVTPGEPLDGRRYRQPQQKVTAADMNIRLVIE